MKGGSGEKKRTGRRKEKLDPHPKRDEIMALYDQDRWADQQIADKVGVSYRIARDVIEKERIVRQARAEAKAEPAIPFDALSKSAQEIMKAWQHQTEKRLREQIEQEERAKIRAVWDETMLPSFSKRLAEAERVIKARKGVWPRSFYRKLLACIHPDRSKSPDAQEVFGIVKNAELLLCKEAEAPTTFVSMPQTVEELLARRRQGQNGA
jgi:hypothetical protein